MKKICIFYSATPGRLFALGTSLNSFCKVHKDLDFDAYVHIEDMQSLDKNNINTPPETDIAAIKKICPNVKFLYTSKDKDTIYSNLDFSLFTAKDSDKPTMKLPINILSWQFLFSLLDQYTFLIKIDDDTVFNTSIENCLDDSQYAILRASTKRIHKTYLGAIDLIERNFDYKFTRKYKAYNVGLSIFTNRLSQFSEFRDQYITFANMFAKSDAFVAPIDEFCFAMTCAHFNIKITNDVRLQVFPKYANNQTVALHATGPEKFWNSEITSYMSPEWLDNYINWVSLGGSRYVSDNKSPSINRLDRWNQLITPKYWIQFLQHHSLFQYIEQLDDNYNTQVKIFTIKGLPKDFIYLDITLVSTSNKVNNIQSTFCLNKKLLSEKSEECLIDIFKRNNYDVINKEVYLYFKRSASILSIDQEIDFLELFLNRNINNISSIFAGQKDKRFFYTSIFKNRKNT